MPLSPPGLRACVLLGLAALCGCENANLGTPPPEDGLFFPGGMLLDPRGGAARDPETGGPARKRFLFVANGNNDLSYSGGTVVAIDLDAFYASWTADEETMAVDPYCPDPDGDDDIDRCVQNVGTRTSPERPCRRLALRPNVVECDESAFVKRTAYVGDFATLLRSSCEVPPGGGPCDNTRLWLPVRGDPSITYVDLLPYTARDDKGNLLDGFTEEDDDGVDFRFDCRNDNDDEGPLDDWPPDVDSRCGKSHKLQTLRGNPELPEIDREPFTMMVSQRDRLAYAAHSDSASLTVVGLDGLKDPTGPNGLTGVPAVVDSPDLFAEPNGLTGGFGLAERPCSLPDNAPTITNGCTRPLVYGGYRYRMLLASFTVQGIDDPAVNCLEPTDDLDAPGEFICDPQLRSVQRFFAGGIDPNSQAPRPVLGDIAFGDERGDELYIVQTYPGAFLKLDTSLGPDGEPFDTQAAPPIELCDEPTRMKLWTDAGQRLAFVTCFRSALIYVIDLDAFRVLETIVGGTGPYELEVDSGREVLYVGNTLERSISVIDISRTRATRFREVARLGLQDPFSK
jgi:hypothetical protein